MTLENIFSAIKAESSFALLGNAHTSVKVINDDVFYVQPTYTEIKLSNKPKFLIFSAPGASGKTALAKYVSHKYNGIYWDLSQITLGENTFYGTMLKALGQEGFRVFIERIRDEKTLFAIDAFDEAEMISGRSGIEFLISDLCDTMNSYKIDCTSAIVLFARTESASFIAQHFDSKGIDYSQYEIGFFTNYNAKQFIKEKIERNGIDITPAVTECIEQQFAVIRELLGTEAESDSFLGYAPVLEALAKAYDEEKNTIKLLGQLTSGENISTKIVYSILDYLLEREHEKVCCALKEKWATKYPNFNEWDDVYTKKEQVIRIAEYIIFNEVAENSFFDEMKLNDELFTEYYDSIKGFVPQHPFLQNFVGNSGIAFAGPAFRDYVWAYLLSTESCVDLALEFFSCDSRNMHCPSQLLVDFFFYINGNTPVNGNIFYVIYDSYKAKETASESAVLSVSQSQDEVILKFGLKSKKNGTISKTVEFMLCGDNIQVSKLSDSYIDTDMKLTIGDAKNNARICNSEIVVKEIVFNTNNIEIESHNSNICLIASALPAQNGSGVNPRFEVRTDDENKIRISLPNIDNYFRLIKYKYVLDSDNGQDYLKFCLALKKIFGCMRKHRKDTPAKDREFVDNEILNQNAFKRSIMDFLLKIEVIYIDSNEPHLYKVDLDKLARHGVNWSNLGYNFGNDMDAIYHEYLSEKKK